MNLNGTDYFCTRNAQGDIIGILDSSVNRVVTYTYDTWGKVIDITGSHATTVGQKNPYRYRGYRYDTETGLYYLQSRYYNPVTSRFLNADAYVSTGQGFSGKNMYAYTLNNPVNMIDPNGYIAIPLIIPIIIIPLAIMGGYSLTDSGQRNLENLWHSTRRGLDNARNNFRDWGVAIIDGVTGLFESRSKNKLKPDSKAEGEHTTWKEDPVTGEVTNHETWVPNPQNPTGFDSKTRYDGRGKTHKNPVTGEGLIPHVHDPLVPGEVRRPLPWEIPPRR